MQPVVEKPLLPADLRSLVPQLQAVLQQYGYRLNKVAPVDGSEGFALLHFSTIPSDYANDAAAAAGGVAVGDVYRTGSALKVRVA